MTLSETLIPLLLLLGALAAWKAGKLTFVGAVAAAVIGAGLWLGTGRTGILVLLAFFLLAVLATAFRKETKKTLGLVEVMDGRRDALQVLANGGAALLLAFCAWIQPSQAALFTVLVTAAIAAATADTLSSEFGNVLGRNFYNVLSLRKDRRGENGVISLEGTLAGIGGSLLIALIYGISAGFTLHTQALIVVAALAGNLFDSVLGASIERKGWISNNGVNFLNTLFAILVAWAGS